MLDNQEMFQLWKSIVRHALELGCARCDWSVLAWNKSSIEYYKSKGGVDMTDSQGYKSFRMIKSVMEEFVKD